MPRNRNRNRSQIVPPAAFPVTLAEVKDQLRITSSDEDDFLDRLIEVATEYTENYLSSALMEQTFKFYYDSFPAYNGGTCEQAIVIPLPPLISITSIEYYDSSNVLQTWSASEYVADVDNFPALVYPDYGYNYPSTRFFAKSVIITAVCGYENSGASPIDLADNVPTNIKQAILLLIGHLYENREMTVPMITIKEIPMGYAQLLVAYRIHCFG